MQFWLHFSACFKILLKILKSLSCFDIARLNLILINKINHKSLEIILQFKNSS